MLCFLLLILPELASSQTIGSVELTSSAQATFQEPITLTCTVQGENLTNFTPQISWFIKSDSNEEARQLHTEKVPSTNSSTFEYPLGSDGESGQYHCSVETVSNETVSNNISIYFRSLTMKQLPEASPVHKNEQVEIQIIQKGDVGKPQTHCEYQSTGTLLGSTLFGFSENYFDARVKFKPEKTEVIICEATFKSDESSYTVNATIEVLVPEWSAWSEYSENCEIRSEHQWQCAKKRNRTCINYSEYSSCDGEHSSFLDCNPDDCEPTVSDWGVWGDTCQFNANMTVCQKSRERQCFRAVNSTRNCAQSLIDYTSCPAEQCDVWSEWEQWSTCAQPENDRHLCKKERHHQCLLVGRECAGEAVEFSECSRGSDCVPTFETHGIKVLRIGYRQMLHLQCDVVESRTLGYRGMEITWKRSSDIVADTAGVDRITLQYTEEKFTERERGMYTCCVTNEIGTRCHDSWDVRLLDHGPVLSDPIHGPDEVMPLTVERGHNITIPCKLEGYKIVYSWRRDQEILPGETDSSLQIVNMSGDQEGSYMCCAYDSVFRKHLCSAGYKISEPENTQRKYLIATISAISLLILALILYITCAHTNKMNSFKRRFRHMFTGGHTKLYNGLDPYETGHVIQRSQSYLKRLSRTRPLSKSELTYLVQMIGEPADPNSDYQENHELGMEFDSIPNNSITINKTPVGTESKNRYLNVLPNPHSRVILPELGNDPISTYVNANYIRGYKLVPKEYIASQGPLPSTSYDFWRLIWEERCRIIVMTTGLIENSRMKCCLYWPATEIGHTMRSGDLEITQLGIYPSRFYTISILKVRKVEEEEENEAEKEGEKDNENEKEKEAEEPTDEGRIIYHLWYHSWPDFGVPEDTGPFLDFVESVRAFKSVLENAPVLVHCSAGIGRTGTFISVNLGIEQFADNGKVDPLGYICQLRQDRGGMIQTLDQYTFVYRALHAYQLRLAARDLESKDKTLIKFGPHELIEDNKLLPEGINLPIVEDIEGSRVDPDFLKCLTQTIRSVSRYSDSTTSVNNLNVNASTESLNRDAPSTPGSPKNGASKPLLAVETKQKRRSKVKSLFFPLHPRGKSTGGSTTSSTNDLRSCDSPQRSLSLNNVKFSKSRENVSLSPRASLPGSQKRVSVVSSKSTGTECSIKIEN